MCLHYLNLRIVHEFMLVLSFSVLVSSVALVKNSLSSLGPCISQDSLLGSEVDMSNKQVGI